MSNEKYVSKYLRCETCYYWKNLRDIKYNKVHKDIKLCGAGFVVKKFTMACKFYTTKRPDVFQRKKKNKNKFERKPKAKFKRAPENKFKMAIAKCPGVEKTLAVNFNIIVYIKNDKYFVAFGNDERVARFVKTRKHLNRLTFKTDLGSAGVEAKVYLSRRLEASFGWKQGRRLIKLIYNKYGADL